MNTVSSNSPDLLEGIVYRKSTGHYRVRTDGRFIDCSISTKLRRVLLYPIADPASITPRVMAVRQIDTVDPVAVGDVVRYLDARDGSGLITEVAERRSRLVRVAAGNKPLKQVIVANLDQVVAVMAAARPDPKWNLLDRYLVSAESLDLPVVIVITKADLLGEGRPEIHETLALYRKLGYAVLLTSAESGEGLPELQTLLDDRLSVLIGKSGVGKTSLLNALQPGLGMQVKAVSAKTSKGRHTTTSLEMVPLDSGGAVVDTPGMREFGVWGVTPEDLAYFFPEMRPWIGLCRFGLGCSHAHEPGCAIKAAVADGQIDQRRYESYLRLRED